MQYIYFYFNLSLKKPLYVVQSMESLVSLFWDRDTSRDNDLAPSPRGLQHRDPDRPGRLPPGQYPGRVN